MLLKTLLITFKLLSIVIGLPVELSENPQDKLSALFDGIQDIAQFRNLSEHDTPEEVFKDYEGFDLESELDHNFNATFNSTSSQGLEGPNHKVYIIGSGLKLNHSDFRAPYVNVEGVNIWNAHLVYHLWPDKLLDEYRHTDYYGIGIAAASACCGERLGSYRKPGLDVMSLKMINFQGRIDPTATVRGFNHIYKDMVENQIKKATIIYAAPHSLGHWVSIPLVRKTIERFTSKLREQGEYEPLVLFPVGDYDEDLSKSLMASEYRKLSANKNVITVGARDQRIDWLFKKHPQSSYGDESLVNVYGPGENIKVWRRSDNIYRDRPKRKWREKIVTEYGTTVAASVLGGKVARVFDETDKTALEVKEEMISKYGPQAPGDNYRN